MSVPETEAPHPDPESEIWSAIAAFEKILEAMPDDRSSLETLSHAYEHIGDQTKTLEYLLRLGDVIIRDRDCESASYICEKLEGYGSADEGVERVCRELKQLLEENDASTMNQGAAPAPAESSAPGTFRMADELSFAWRLFEAGELTQEEYSGVAQDLSEMSTEEHLSTISVLHALSARAFSGMERLMGYVARGAKTPIVSLESFDIPAEAHSLLPLEFAIRRGAIVYGLLAEDALVVVMNPYDSALREQVSTLLGKTCHFFISAPVGFDDAIARIRETPPA
ncbi:MAG: hypothetical protein HN341_17585 [Verrucomicrobia bacterium]|jgi:hypothetical protein|nr:hypothetical protein [Verrucomicrobiota bacterium]